MRTTRIPVSRCEILLDLEVLSVIWMLSVQGAASATSRDATEARRGVAGSSHGRPQTARATARTFHVDVVWRSGEVGKRTRAPAARNRARSRKSSSSSGKKYRIAWLSVTSSTSWSPSSVQRSVVDGAQVVAVVEAARSDADDSAGRASITLTRSEGRSLKTAGPYQTSNANSPPGVEMRARRRERVENVGVRVLVAEDGEHHQHGVERLVEADLADVAGDELGPPVGRQLGGLLSVRSRSCRPIDRRRRRRTRARRARARASRCRSRDRESA